MWSRPSRTAVPGATISRALTSRGSCRASSSETSSPAYGMDSDDRGKGSIFPAFEAARGLSSCSGGGAEPPRQGLSERRTQGPAVPRVQDAAEPELGRPAGRAVGMGGLPERAGQPERAEGGERLPAFVQL